MKRIIVICLAALMVSGCSPDPSKDKKYLSDSEGNVFLTEHRIGDCYFLNKVDKEAIKAQLEVIEKVEVK